MINWQPIDTCPKNEFEVYLGYDKHGEEMSDREECLVLISWDVPDEGDDWEPDWNVQPLKDRLDYVFDERTNITMWAPLSELLPKAA